jgi:hypothetical protein
MPEPCITYAHKQECNIWNSELWDFKQLYNGNTDGLDIYICLAAFDPLIQDSEKKAHRVRLIVLIAVLGSIFTALCGLSITIKMFQNTSSKKTFSDNDSLIVYDYSFFTALHR